MKINLTTIEVFGEKGLEFENLNGWNSFDYISQIIEKILNGEKIQFIMEGYHGLKWYYLKPIVFELIYDEDIGIYLKNLTRDDFIEYYIDKNLGKGFEILAEVDFEQTEKNFLLLRDIANEFVSYINKEIAANEEFKINEYISLELVKDNTIIIIDGKPFSKCLGLYMIIPKHNETQENMNSIDEANENFNIQQFGINLEQFKLDPKEEFWGHCSNIQAWVENNYDTRIIHYNLAFPLLKELTDAGDPLAKRVFKEEIVKRYKSGFPSVVKFLEEEYYLYYLTKEEREAL